MSGIKRVFSDGFNGMVIGFFVTMIIGTILKQIGNLTPGQIGDLFVTMGKAAISVTGAGVGVGVAGEQHGGIVLGDDGRAGNDGVAVILEELQEQRAQLIGGIALHEWSLLCMVCKNGCI